MHGSEPWIEMDCFYFLFMNFLKHQSFGGMDFQWKNIIFSGFILLKMSINAWEEET